MKKTFNRGDGNGNGARSRGPAPVTIVGLALVGLAGCAEGDRDAAFVERSDGPVGSAESALSCMTLQRGAGAAVEDAHIVFDPTDPSRASTNYGTANALTIGTLGTTTGQSLLKFDLSALPAGTIIQSATLSLRKAQSSSQASIDLHSVVAPWSESAVTWTSFAGAFDPAAELTIDPSAAPVGGYLTADLTSLVGAWHAGGLANEGILLAQGGSGRVTVGSSDAGLLHNQPSLSVCYLPAPTCNDGLQNQDESDVDCGGATCAACPTCNDGLQNQDESDVDCGGATCAACPTCNDGLQNQDETDVDCGGATCAACCTVDYATWSTTRNYATTLSADHRTAIPTTNWNWVQSDVCKSSGKWYVETTKVGSGPSYPTYWMVGVASSTASTFQYGFFADDVTSAFYHAPSPGFIGLQTAAASYVNASSSAGVVGVNQVLGVALDMDARQITFTTATATSGPYALPGAAATYCIHFGYGHLNSVRLNAGQDAFTYAMPQGYSPLYGTCQP